MSVTVASRSRRPSPSVVSALLWLIGGAALALGIVALATGSRTGPAFPRWQPIPGFPASGASVQALLKRCGAATPGSHRENLGRLVVSERRGPYAGGVYTGTVGQPGNSSVCISSGSASSGVASGAEWCSSSSLVLGGAIRAGGIQTAQTLQTCVLQGRDGNAFVTFARGRVGPGVTTVTIERRDGSLVQATVAHGWYLAWWPGETTKAVAAVTGASGHISVASLN